MQKMVDSLSASSNGRPWLSSAASTCFVAAPEGSCALGFRVMWGYIGIMENGMKTTTVL